MAGTKAGGIKAAATNKAKHGENFYAEIGRIGGKSGHTGGFAANPKLAQLAGMKGGKNSHNYRVNAKKVVRNGQEMTQIIVHKITGAPKKLEVKHGNNKH